MNMDQQIIVNYGNKIDERLRKSLNKTYQKMNECRMKKEPDEYIKCNRCSKKIHKLECIRIERKDGKTAFPLCYDCYNERNPRWMPFGTERSVYEESVNQKE